MPSTSATGVRAEGNRRVDQHAASPSAPDETGTVDQGKKSMEQQRRTTQTMRVQWQPNPHTTERPRTHPCGNTTRQTPKQNSKDKLQTAQGPPQTDPAGGGRQRPKNNRSSQLLLDTVLHGTLHGVHHPLHSRRRHTDTPVGLEVRHQLRRQRRTRDHPHPCPVPRRATGIPRRVPRRPHLPSTGGRARQLLLATRYRWPHPPAPPPQSARHARAATRTLAAPPHGAATAAPRPRRPRWVSPPRAPPTAPRLCWRSGIRLLASDGDTGPRQCPRRQSAARTPRPR